MIENKYTPYTSQKPTDGDPNSRAYKRRQCHESWSKQFLAQEGRMNFIRNIRRSAWKRYWIKFKTQIVPTVQTGE